MTRRSLVRAIANHSVIADWRNIGPQISQKTYRRRGKQTARGRGDISHTAGNRVARYIDVSAASNSCHDRYRYAYRLILTPQFWELSRLSHTASAADVFWLYAICAGAACDKNVRSGAVLGQNIWGRGPLRFLSFPSPPCSPALSLEVRPLKYS